MNTIKVRVYPNSEGFGWMLYQGTDCVGSSEKSSLSREGAMASARRYAERFGYGESLLYSEPQEDHPAPASLGVALPAACNRWRYRLLLRPASFSTLPPGLTWRFVEAPPAAAHSMPGLPSSRHRYGVIATDRELTEIELKRFDIEPVQKAAVS